ncbi:MAG: SHOCT domain-containing protein [Lentisphaerae bacterium]|nr:SHOCT domain-containing protein [Lentisphaerota bacterium]
MKNVIGKCLFGCGMGFFCGYVIIAVGLGSVCPSLYKVASPIVCGDNQSLEVVQHRYSWRPGTAMWTAAVYRVDRATGNKEDRTSLVKLVSGAIYGLGIFALLLPWICRKTVRPAAGGSPGAHDVEPSATTESTPAGSIDEKLAKLRQLHEDNLITTAEYEQKKAEILKGI